MRSLWTDWIVEDMGSFSGDGLGGFMGVAEEAGYSATVEIHGTAAITITPTSSAAR